MNEGRRVLALGVRGSRESDSESTGAMGPTVHEIVLKIGEDLTRKGDNTQFECRGVSYPASAIRYRTSRTRGSAELRRLLYDEAMRDDSVTFALIGLSQGADVVRHAIAALELDTALIDRIVAIVLLGDPNRHAGSAEKFQHGSDDARPGLLARRGVVIRTDLVGRAWSYCLSRDRICANSWGPLGVVFSGTHTHYERNADHVLDLAAAFVVDQIHRSVEA